MSKYIRFEPAMPKPKTKVWHVVANDGNATLGSVQWYGPWRKYCFFPAQSTVFEQVCLRDIAQFIEDQTRVHKAAG